MHVQNVIVQNRQNMNGDKENLTINNELFYNPVEVDYNDIFYRNEDGMIDSDDKKGRKMITELKLYRTLYGYAWILEELDSTATKLEAAIASGKLTEEKKEQYIKAKHLVDEYYRKVNRNFSAVYKSNEKYNGA